MVRPSATHIIPTKSQRLKHWNELLNRSYPIRKVNIVIHVTDSQIVGETQSTLWSVLQQGPVNMLLIIKNSGVNTMNYQIQEFNGSAWNTLGPSGSDFYDTLSVNEVKCISVTSTYPQIQMVGNASGGAFLEFSVTRYFNRSSGGPLPILTL